MGFELAEDALCLGGVLSWCLDVGASRYVERDECVRLVCDGGRLDGRARSLEGRLEERLTCEAERTASGTGRCATGGVTVCAGGGVTVYLRERDTVCLRGCGTVCLRGCGTVGLERRGTVCVGATEWAEK
eukprot:Blabericola_migrator_1__8269@NODE_428_length_8580_cov_384_028075_g151_i1_p8_GENE_NODE_428_length_8580_cov_384_028075_g151_i1NODE_428_length_8580_cov_384_028075_g151_i1_p8_ORF_typecomplete_len130_score25_90_NODE_428_length_8580_cov_384_028075_g151_i174457834